MDDHDQFIVRTRLEEGVLDVREGDVHVVPLLRGEPHPVLVDLQVAQRLLAHDVRPDHQVIQCLLLPALRRHQLLALVLLTRLLLHCLFLVQQLHLLYQILYLLVFVDKVVLTATCLVLQGQFLYEQGVWGVRTGRELQGRTAWNMKVESEVSPLALRGGGHVLDGADVERYEGVPVDWHQYTVMLFIHEQMSRLQILDWELPFTLVGTDVAHLLDLFLLGGALYLVPFTPFP